VDSSGVAARHIAVCILRAHSEVDYQPCRSGAGALTIKCVAGPEATVIPLEVPVMEAMAVSVAVMVQLLRFSE